MILVSVILYYTKMIIIFLIFVIMESILDAHINIFVEIVTHQNLINNEYKLL